MKIQRLTASVRRAAEALDVDRSILARLIADRGIRPAAHQGGHPVFYLSDLARALRDADPERESPRAALDRARAARERLRYRREAAALIPVHELRQGHAAIMKAVQHAYEVLPDQLERDCGLSGRAVEAVERVLDASRTELHQLICRADPPVDGGTDSPTNDGDNDRE